MLTDRHGSPRDGATPEGGRGRRELRRAGAVPGRDEPPGARARAGAAGVAAPPWSRQRQPAPPPPSIGDVAVACIDDDTLIREGVTRLLPGVRVVAAFERVEDFLAARPRVDVVLLDLWLRAPDGESSLRQGAAAVAAVHRAGYRVLIYTNERRRQVLAGCLAAGAQGVIHKSESLETVVESAREVASGRVVITTALAGLAELVERRGGMPHLSPRQVDVLRGRARGETYKSIAARLDIAPKTAEEYMGEVNRRFSDYMRSHSAADLERHLGIGFGDLLGDTR